MFNEPKALDRCAACDHARAVHHGQGTDVCTWDACDCQGFVEEMDED